MPRRCAALGVIALVACSSGSRGARDTGGGGAVETLERFADRACACTDQACTAALDKAMATALATPLTVDLVHDEAAFTRADTAMQRTIACMFEHGTVAFALQHVSEAVYAAERDRVCACLEPECEPVAAGATSREASLRLRQLRTVPLDAPTEDRVSTLVREIDECARGAASPLGAAAAAAVAAIASRACECKEPACFDQIRLDYRAWRLEASGTTFTSAQSDVVRDAHGEIGRCFEPTGGHAVIAAPIRPSPGGATSRRVRDRTELEDEAAAYFAIGEKMCACEHAACVTRVDADLARYFDTATLVDPLTGENPWPDDLDALTTATVRRIRTCALMLRLPLDGFTVPTIRDWEYLREAACACSDAACLTQVTDAFMKTAEQADGLINGVNLEAGKAILAEAGRCVIETRVSQALLELRELRGAACACTEAACVADIDARFRDWASRNADTHGTQSDNDKAAEIAEEISRCLVDALK